jgi:hypothetical protein
VCFNVPSPTARILRAISAYFSVSQLSGKVAPKGRGPYHRGNSVVFFRAIRSEAVSGLRCYVLVPDGRLRGSAGPAHVESMAAFIAAVLRIDFVLATWHPLLRLQRLDVRTILRSKIIASDKKADCYVFP